MTNNTMMVTLLAAPALGVLTVGLAILTGAY